MTTKIEAPFTITQADEATIKTALQKLTRYNDRISTANVYFKLGDGHMPNSVIAEIEIHVPGPTLFVSDIEPNFLDAFKGALNKMDRIFRKEKDKRQSKR